MNKNDTKLEARLTKGVLRMSGRIARRLHSLEKRVVAQLSELTPQESLDLYAEASKGLLQSRTGVQSIVKAGR